MSTTNGQPPDSIWQGTKVRLRATEPSDWETFFAWNEDSEQARAVYFVPFPQSRASVRQFAQDAAMRAPESDNFRFLIENSEREVVGDVTTHGCDQRAGALSWGLNITQGHRRKGYATEALLLLMRYYFQELRYQKVTVCIYSFNEASVKLHERLGFQLEGRIRRTVYTRGQYFDQLVYGLTREEFAERHASMQP